MAQRVEVHLVDDIDGGPATETVRFALDGVEYEIDLRAENAAALREGIELFRLSARRVRTGRSRQARPGPAGRTGPSAEELRVWARANGFTPSDRGRISEEIRNAYAAAQVNGSAEVGEPDMANFEARITLGQPDPEGTPEGEYGQPEFRHAEAGV